jgi:sulfotransferase family protein
MRILVVGLPRSGTSWFAEALSHARGVRYVAEPDNRDSGEYATVGMRGLDIAPVLAPGDRARGYERLFAVAFRGGWLHNPRIASVTALARRAPRLGAPVLTAIASLARRRPPTTEHQLVKTVRANQSVEWIADRFDPFVVVVWRNPLNALPGLIKRDARAGEVGPGVVQRLRDTAAWPPPELGTVARATWNTCARLTMLTDAALRHREWLVVQHEDLCVDPIPSFKYVFARVGLDWSDSVAAFLEESNRPGDTFETRRVTRDQVDAWKKLSEDQLSEAVVQMRRFLPIEGIGPLMERSLAAIERPRVIDLRD